MAVFEYVRMIEAPEPWMKPMVGWLFIVQGNKFVHRGDGVRVELVRMEGDDRYFEEANLG